jgi:hypothetical protein
MIDRGASLPAFMRRPPAAFRVKASDQAIRMVGLGDFGTGMDSQRRVAAAIVGMAKADRFDFGLTFGDNFYPSGMKGTDDPRWKDWWEALYGPLGITFHPSLGNHEWYSDDGAAAEIAYRSPTWEFPAPYYTFTAGPVQFFAVDTTEISEAQILWLDRGDSVQHLPMEGRLRTPPGLRPRKGTPSRAGTWTTCRPGSGPSSGAGWTPTSAATSTRWPTWSRATGSISS